MWNRRILIAAAAIVVMTFSLPVAALQPIKVLLARTSGVSNSDAREMLEQINNLAENSDLGFLGGFESASMSLGVPEVFLTVCGSSNLLSLTQCAKDNLSQLRSDKNADIALLMVSQDITNDCGGVGPGVINALTVSQDNETLAFAVIEKNCFNEQTNNQVVASHEVGHLLAIEHVDGDPTEALPALAGALGNHAYENIFNNATAVASPGDCAFAQCTWHNFFSDKDKDFSSTFLDDAGNSDSDAVEVVSTLSWNVVADYRPYPGEPPCQISASYVTHFCNNPNPGVSTSATLIGGSGEVLNAIYQTKIGSIWTTIFDGILTCPVFGSAGVTDIRALLQTAYGISQCQIPLQGESCGGPPPF